MNRDSLADGSDGHTDEGDDVGDDTRDVDTRRALIGVVVMGVSGSGKSTIGVKLADRLRARFVDSDDLHSEANREKMRHGIPLTDDDRMPWLTAVGETIRDELAEGRTIVVACSALRRRYRDRITRAANSPVVFLHLTGPRDIIAGRLTRRTEHFMPGSLLDSQFETLEPLEPDERGIRVENHGEPDAIVRRAVELLATIVDV